MKQHWHDLRLFIVFIWQRFQQERCTQIAASLTFTSLLSLVPLVTIALTVFSAFPGFQQYASQTRNFLQANLMPAMAQNMLEHIEQFASSASHLTTIGIIFLGVTALMMLLTIEEAFNIIWKTPKPRKMLRRLLIYWAMLTLGPLLIGISLSITSWIISLSSDYTRQIPVLEVLLLKAIPILLVTLTFTMTFRILPNRFVPLNYAFIGGFIAAIAFEMMSTGFGYYISHFDTYTLVYGAFSTIPIFLLWIYLSWIVVLVGAVITASLSHWRAPSRQQRSANLELLQAFRLLQLLYHNFHIGSISHFPQLAKQLKIDYDSLEALLNQLDKAGIISRTGRNGWLLRRDPAQIYTLELLQIFLICPNLRQTQQSEDPIEQWMAHYANRLEQSDNISLQQLFEQAKL